MVTRNITCSSQLSYSLNRVTEKLTHIWRAWREDKYKPQVICTANLCTCQNIWCKPVKLSLGCCILAPIQMTGILMMAVSRYLFSTSSYRQGKLAHKISNSPRSPGSLLWLIGPAFPCFDSPTPLTFCEQPPFSGWLHKSMGWQENPSPSYPSMQMHLKSISTKGTQI